MLSPGLSKQRNPAQPAEGYADSDRESDRKSVGEPGGDACDK